MKTHVLSAKGQHGNNENEVWTCWSWWMSACEWLSWSVKHILLLLMSCLSRQLRKILFLTCFSNVEVRITQRNSHLTPSILFQALAGFYVSTISRNVRELDEIVQRMSGQSLNRNKHQNISFEGDSKISLSAWHHNNLFHNIFHHKVLFSVWYNN